MIRPPFGRSTQEDSCGRCCSLRSPSSRSPPSRAPRRPSSATSSRSTPTPRETSTGPPRRTSDRAGNFVVTWNDETGADGDGYGVRGRLFDVKGSPLGGEFTVTDVRHEQPGVRTRRFERERRLRRDLDRRGDPAGGGYQIYARRFNSTGTPQGGNIAVNTYTTGTPGILERGARLDGQLRRGLAEHRAGRLGFRRVRPALRQRRRQGRSRIPGQPADDGRAAGRSRREATDRRVHGRLAEPPGRSGRRGHGPPIPGERDARGRRIPGEHEGARVPVPAGRGATSATAARSSSGRATARMDRTAGVYGQRLDASGAKLGPEFNVNTYTTGFQGRPRWPSRPDGRLRRHLAERGAGRKRSRRSGAAVRRDRQAAGCRASGQRLHDRPPGRAARGGPAERPVRRGLGQPDRRRQQQHRGAARRLPRSGRDRGRCARRVADGGSNHNGVLEPEKPRSCSSRRSRTTRTTRFRSPERRRISAACRARRTRCSTRRPTTARSPPVRRSTASSRPATATRLRSPERVPPSTGTRCSTRRSRTRASLAPRLCTSEAASPTCPRQRLLPVHRESLPQRRHRRLRGRRLLPGEQRHAGADGGLPAEGSMGIAVRSGAGDGDGVPRRSGEQPLRALDRGARPRGHHGGLRQRPLLPRQSRHASADGDLPSQDPRRLDLRAARGRRYFPGRDPVPQPELQLHRRALQPGHHRRVPGEPRFCTARKTRCFASRWPSFS